MAQETASIKRRIWLFIAFCAVTVLYLCIGAAGMRALERPREDDTLQKLNDTILHLNLTKEQQTRLSEIGVCNWPNPDFPHWTFSGAMFFSLTVITTIGYGSYAPRTQNGRSFTAVFAVIGISIIGQLLASCAGLISGVIKACRQRRRRQADTQVDIGAMDDKKQQLVWEASFSRHEDGDGRVTLSGLESLIKELLDDDADPALVDHIVSKVNPAGHGTLSRAAVSRALLQFHIAESEVPRGDSAKGVLVTVFIAMLFILLWSFIFMGVEGWTYRESMWFCFVTVTTIGFGDFVPQTYSGRALCFIFIVPGLGLGGATLGSIWEFFVTKRFWLLQKNWAAGRLSTKFMEAHGITVLFKHPSSVRRVRRRPRRAAGCIELPLLESMYGGPTGWNVGASKGQGFGSVRPSHQKAAARSQEARPATSRLAGQRLSAAGLPPPSLAPERTAPASGDSSLELIARELWAAGSLGAGAPGGQAPAAAAAAGTAAPAASPDPLPTESGGRGMRGPTVRRGTVTPSSSCASPSFDMPPRSGSEQIQGARADPKALWSSASVGQLPTPPASAAGAGPPAGRGHRASLVMPSSPVLTPARGSSTAAGRFSSAGSSSAEERRLSATIPAPSSATSQRDSVRPRKRTMVGADRVRPARPARGSQHMPMVRGGTRGPDEGLDSSPGGSPASRVRRLGNSAPGRAAPHSSFSGASGCPLQAAGPEPLSPLLSPATAAGST